MSEDEIARLLLMASIEGGSHFWSKEVREQSATQVVELLLSGFYTGTKNSAEKITARIKTLNPEQLVNEIESSNSQLITPSHSNWPVQVEDLLAPPFGLLVRGDSTLLTEPSIAIVGSRNPTSYGIRIAGEFAAGIADRDWVVASGGAYGIDTAAHKGALAAEGGTIVVLGSGINQKYPAGNERLFAEIEVTGALVSEVLPSVHAHPARFLIRNRIIASLSRATLVVEAAYRSGSLRTARDAAEIMRVVMATPGSITSPSSEGCHRLIANNEAVLVSSVGDVMELVLPLNDARMAT